MLPKNLYLVRHGESEGNVASKRSKAGDSSAFTPEFRRRHSSKWRLTDRGIWQTEQAALCLSAEKLVAPERKYTSDYLRAKETSLHLGLGDGWLSEFYLRERDWGALDAMPQEERHERFGAELAKRDIDGFYWAPPGNPSQSMADLCLRADRVLDTLHRECSQMDDVVIVCHGEVMWAFRVRLERLSQRRFRELDLSNSPFDHIHNCQIIQYTRINPETGFETKRLNSLRSICPWDTTLSSNIWQPIERRTLTLKDLQHELELTPRLLNNPLR